MSVIHPDLSLTEVVRRTPGAGRVLSSLGLDYCCRGETSLAAAVAGAGLDLDDVLARLRPTLDEERPTWTDAGPLELVAHIEAVHHAYLWAELPRLGALVDKVHGVHGGRHPELAEVARLWDLVVADLVPHLHKEEQVLFPWIRRLAEGEAAEAGGAGGGRACATVRAPIARMMQEHDELGTLLGELRRATDGYRPPADACASFLALYDGLATFEADTHLHVHKEDDLLFRAAVALEPVGGAAG